MPQLVPFFFVNQVVFSFVILTVLIYAFSKYILPSFVRIFLSRLYINKLQAIYTDKNMVIIPKN